MKGDGVRNDGNDGSDVCNTNQVDDFDGVAESEGSNVDVCCVDTRRPNDNGVVDDCIKVYGDSECRDVKRSVKRTLDLKKYKTQSWYTCDFVGCLCQSHEPINEKCGVWKINKGESKGRNKYLRDKY